MLIDAHHHLWNPARAPYPWLTPDLGPINRPMEFEELAPLLAAAGIDRTVVVQSSENDADTDYMLEVADAQPAIGAVVAWLPLDRPADAARRLEEIEGHPAFRGVRCSINFEPDVEWLLRPEVGEGLALLEARGIPFDVVSVRRRHLELVPILSERHPDLVLIIDHLSKPPIGRDESWVSGWQQNLRAAAANPNVLAKVSGPLPGAGRPRRLDRRGRPALPALRAGGLRRRPPDVGQRLADRRPGRRLREGVVGAERAVRRAGRGRARGHPRRDGGAGLPDRGAGLMPGLAVIGASERRIPWTSWLLDSLAQYGYADPVWLINPGHQELLGRPCLPSLDAVPGDPDLGVILTNADQAVLQCEALVARGCARVVIVSNGFGELRTDEGRARDAALRRIAEGRDVEIIGPNCVGFASFHDGVCAITQPVPDRRGARPVSIFSQSGGLTGAALGAVQREGLGVDLCYSLGNGTAFGLARAVRTAARRPTTRVVCCVVEAVGDPDELAAAAAEAQAADVLLAVLLLGRSAGGRSVAQSHTGAIVGESALVAAWLRALGVVVVDSAEELGPGGRPVAATRARLPRRRGLHRHRVRRQRGTQRRPRGAPRRALARLGPTTEATLRELLPEGAYVGNPLDVQTGDGQAVYTALASDPAVGYLIEPWPLPWPDESPRFPWQRAALERIAGIGRAHGTPVAVASLFEQAPSDWARGLEAGGGVSVTPDLELTLAALGRLARVPAPAHAGAPDARSAARPGLVAEAAARDVLAAAGLPLVRGAEAATPDAAVALAGELRGPLAVKVSLADVGHKDRIGGVRLGLTSPEEVRAACDEIAASAVAAGAAATPGDVRFLVTELAFGPEVLVGALRDPVAGPTVTVAVGGWAAEAGAPLGTIVGAPDAAAIEALARGWDLPRLLGARRTADLVAFLERFAAAFATGALAGYGTVEINPLILAPGGPVIVDALLVEEES